MAEFTMGSDPKAWRCEQMKIDSIIFDLDGTLWDAVHEISEAWNRAIDRYPEIRRITEEELKGCMGLPINDIGKKLFPNIDENFQIKLMEQCCHEEEEYLRAYGGSLYPKLEETLKSLSEKYKLFVVSNCQEGYIQCFFQAHSLGKYFCDFECAGFTGLSKGENNKLIMERNNLKNPVYVGDTIMDAEAASVAGIPFVYARYGFGKVEKYDYIIDNIDELITLEI